jgi:hypothetical protein
VSRLRFGLAAVLLLAAGTAHAQFPSPYAGASLLQPGGHVFGAYVPISENAVGALAQLRLSFLPGVDFGFQGGLSRLDRNSGSKTLVRMGTDVRFRVAAESEARPVSMAVGAGLGVFSGDDYNVLTLGPNFLVSRSWRKGEAGEFSPFAGIGLSLATVNVGTFDDNDFSMPAKVGAEIGITPTARLVFELSTRLGADSRRELANKAEFSLGANLPF